MAPTLKMDDGEEARGLLMDTYGVKGAEEGDAEIHANGRTRHRNSGTYYEDARIDGAARAFEISEAGYARKARWSVGNDPRRRFLAPILFFLESVLAYLRGFPAQCRERGFWGVARDVFNYPEPDVKIRGTAWLDGLRGLAAFEVFVFHYDDGWIDRSLAWGTCKYCGQAWYYAPFIRTVYGAGDAAVCLFFAISGYVLSYRALQLIREKKHEQLLGSLSSAVFRRGIRLYMPVMVETFTLMLLCRFLGLPKPMHYEAAPTLWLELKSWYIAFIHLLMPLRYPDRWDALQDRYDGGISWTIPLEYYGSIYIYGALLFLSRTSSVVVRRCLIFMMVTQSFVKDDWIAAQFMMGMAFADFQLEREEIEQREQQHPHLVRRSGLWEKIRPFWYFGFFVFGFYLSGLPGGRMVNDPTVPQPDIRIESRPHFDWFVQPIAWMGWYYKRQTDRYVLCFATMSSLIGIGMTPALKRILETRVVQYLGRISFGLYLCHIFVRSWIVDYINDASLRLVGFDPEKNYEQRLMSDNGRLFLAYALMMVPAMTVNFMVAGAFQRYLDDPSVRTGKRWEAWCLSFGKDKNSGSVLNGAAVSSGPDISMQEVGATRRNESTAIP